MSRSFADRRRPWRRGVAAAWTARAEDARLRRLVRDELDAIADRREPPATPAGRAG